MQNRFISIITTKLRPPRLVQPALSRPRLMSQLEKHKSQPLTLLMGPAGYGKTTLMTQWREALTSAGINTGWLTLDDGDNIADQFLSYLCSACKQLEPSMSVQIEEFGDLGSARVPQYIVAEIVNTLAEQEKEYALFLDDYHRINDEQIHEILQYLLFNLPPNLNIYIGSRSVPPFSLSRLKVAGQVHLLGSESLRFDQQEAERFLLDRTQLSLEPQDMAVLLERTEGWPAALQLASPSLSRLDDRERFIESFSGSHRSVTDFLAEEVLNSLPPRVLELLLKTAVVDRFNIPLCIALTGEADAQAMLETPQSDSFLLQRFDDEESWYRFHPLVRSFLRTRLSQQKGEEVLDLHAQAAAWFEQQGLISEAVEQLLKAERQEHALSLLEQYAFDMLDQGQLALLISLVRKLPQSQLASCEKILVPLAWAQLLSYRTDDLQALLDQMDSLIEHAEGDQRRAIELDISVIRAALQAFFDDFDGCQTTINQWPQAVDIDRPFLEATMGNIRESVCLAAYRFEDVYRLQRQSERLYDRLEYPGTKFYGRLFAILALLDETRLSEAKSLSTDTLDLCKVSQGQGAVFRKQTTLTQGIAHYYSGETDRALALFKPNIDVLKNYAISDLVIKVLPPFVRVYQRKQGRGKAQTLLNQFAYLAKDRGLVRMQACVLHEQVRASILENDPQAALRLFEQASVLEGFSAADTQAADAQAWEWYQLAKTRLLIHSKNADQADAILQSLQQRFQAQGRSLRLLETCLLQARSAAVGNDREGAMAALSKALSLPADEQLVQPFVDEGEGMAPLYRRLADETASLSTRNLCEFIIERIETSSASTMQPPETVPEGAVPSTQPLVDPLSKRELEVLTLVAQGLSNRDIAEQLFLSIDTVKTHLKSIFSKMSVARRTQAVSLGRELKLID